MLDSVLWGLILVVAIVMVLTYVSYTNFSSARIETLTTGSKLATTSAGQIEYVMRGTTGPMVLFLHGTPGGYDQSPDEAAYRMIAPSRPGYLRTPLEVGRTPQAQADAYLALLDELGITEKVWVMGASGGGPSAYTFAATYPERTQGLIALEAISHTWEPDEEGPGFLRKDFLSWLMLNLIQRLGGPSGITKMLIPDPDNQQRILKSEENRSVISELVWSTWPPSHRNAGLENDMAQFKNLSVSLEDVSVPTLAIHGTADINVPIDHAHYASERIADFTLRTLEHADHWMPFTHSEEMGDVIEAFINSRHQSVEVTPDQSSPG